MPIVTFLFGVFLIGCGFALMLAAMPSKKQVESVKYRRYLFCYEIAHVNGTGSAHGTANFWCSRLDYTAMLDIACSLKKEVSEKYPDCEFGDLVWRSVTPLDEVSDTQPAGDIVKCSQTESP